MDTVPRIGAAPSFVIASDVAMFSKSGDMETIVETVSSARVKAPVVKRVTISEQREKREEREKEEESETKKHKRFLRGIREAFDAYSTETDRLTKSEWLQSVIRKRIHEGRLTEEEYDKYFDRIDTDFDGVIGWTELVHYLMMEIANVDLGKNNDTVQFIHKAKTPTHALSHTHRGMVSQILFSRRRGEYISLSPDSIRFWYPGSLGFRAVIQEPGLFAAMVLLENSCMLAVTTTNRRLVFYELESLVQLPTEICASPSPKTIQGMNEQLAHGTLETLDSPDMPMFNAPTVMCLAEMETHERGVSLFFVGDDQGVIEAFEMCASIRRLGMDCRVARIGRYVVHDGAVTQISKIGMLNAYASSSLDKTLKIWTFVPEMPPKGPVKAWGNDNVVRDPSTNGTLTVLRVFTDEEPLISFFYSDHQKYLVTCGVGRDAFVWSLSPPKKMAKLAGHYNTLEYVTEFETTTGDKYLLTMTSRKEFRLWDAVSFRMVREWSDPSVHRPSDRYSAVFFDIKRHALITASSDIFMWCEDISAMNEVMELRTHTRPIIGCLLSNEFNQLVTVDSICTIKVWDIRDGTNASVHQEPWSPGTADITAVSLDIGGRRMVTSSFTNEVNMWNYNCGTVIGELKLNKGGLLITKVMFCKMNGRDYLITAGWDKAIVAYTEVEPCHFDRFRLFKAHENDISAIVGLPTGLVSGSVTGELYLWSLDTSSPICTNRIESEACIECLVRGNGCVFVGDAMGCMHIVTLPKLQIRMSFPAHNLTVKHSLTVMYLDEETGTMYTADTLGYVKTWQVYYDNGIPCISPGQLHRCHGDEISELVLFGNGQFLATCGVDMIVRVWHVATFKFVGFFSSESHWDLQDPATWVKTPPFEIDKRHVPVEKPLSVPTTRSIRTVRSIAQLPGNRDGILKQMQCPELSSMIIEEDDEGAEPQEPTTDFQAIGRIVDDYAAEFAKKQAGMDMRVAPRLIAEVDATVIGPISELETPIRPSELLDNIQKLAHRKNILDDRASLTSVNLRKRVIRLPVPVGPPVNRVKYEKRKKGLPFLAQMTPFY